MSWADRVLTEAVEAAATTGDRRLAAHALVQRGFLRLFTEADVDAEELIDVAERSIAVFEELRDELGPRPRLAAESSGALPRAPGGAVCGGSERALVHARRAGDRFEEQEIVEWLVIALLLGPAPAAERPPSVRRLLARSAQPAAAGGDPCCSALARSHARAHRRGPELIARARETIGVSWASGSGSLVLARLHVRLAGRSGRGGARAPTRPTTRSKDRREEPLLHDRARPLACCSTRRADTTRPNSSRTNAKTRRVRTMSTPRSAGGRSGRRSSRSGASTRRPSSSRGRPSPTPRRSDFLLAHAEAMADLAEVLELGGRRTEAIDALRGALELDERKGNLLAAERTRSRLADLLAQQAE